MLIKTDKTENLQKLFHMILLPCFFRIEDGMIMRSEYHEILILQKMLRSSKIQLRICAMHFKRSIYKEIMQGKKRFIFVVMMAGC